MHPRKNLPSAQEIAKLPPDGGPDFNRLVHEKSPYLLQHAANPVDWYPWGPEAFEKARREDKPVFLSIGYSSCHWCHVMEHESFERDDVAELLNRYFVCIKVDREERPDLDDLYMVATQVITGRGGWPNSVWLTPEGEPWFAGTYFPREDRGGQPGFMTLLTRLAEVWQTRRAEVKTQAEQLSAAIRQNAAASTAAPGGEAPDVAHLVQQAVAAYRDNYDLRNGGFGGAPKFPPHAALALLLHVQREKPDPGTLEIITGTLDAMRRGGIHDHIGGGFHRYSTDERWFLPHFEKMLYDNAQLARAYTEAWQATGNVEDRRTAEDVLDWVLRDMTGPEGGFFSALDADSEGEEGKFYVWSEAEVMRVLGPSDGKFFCNLYGILPSGNFHEEATGKPTGLNIPHLSDGSDTSDLQRIESCKTRLRDVRAKRVWPGLDDKILTGWNGLLLGSFAYAGHAFNEPRYTDAAIRAARFLLHDLRRDGKLLRSYRQGEARVQGYLEDYAALADGLLDLHDATGEASWLREAQGLADFMLAHFWDNEQGGFFFTADDHENLLARNKDVFDQAMPSGNGLAVRVLVRLSQLTDRTEYAEKARAAVAAFAPALRRLPTATSSLLLAASMMEKQGEAPVTLPSEKPIEVSIAADRKVVHPGSEVTVTLDLNIAGGWHIQAHKPSEPSLKPTTVEAVGSVFSLVSVDYPVGQMVAAGGFDKLRVYQGHTTITAHLMASDKLSAGFSSVRLRLSWQACDDSTCLAPETVEQELTLRVAQ